MKRNGRTCFESLLPNTGVGGCKSSCWCRARCRSKRIREQMGHRRPHRQDVPSARKGPNACSCQTLGKWFPHNTHSVVKTMQGRTAHRLPKIMRFEGIAHILHTLLMKGLCRRKVCLFNHGRDVWQVIPVVSWGGCFSHCFVHLGVAFQLAITGLVERLRVFQCRPQGLFGTIWK